MDPAKRDGMYREIQMELIRQAVYFFMCQPMNIHAARDWVKGNYYNPMLSVSSNGDPTYWTVWKEPYTTAVAIFIGLNVATMYELKSKLPSFLQ